MNENIIFYIQMKYQGILDSSKFIQLNDPEFPESSK